MNLMKIFVLGRREANAFAGGQGCELDDAGTISVLKRIRNHLASGDLSRADQALLSYVTLLTADRYYAHADRMLKTCREPSHTDAHGLETLPGLIDSLVETLGFYRQVEVAERLPENSLASAEDLTNRLFAIIAVNYPQHLQQMAEDWQQPDVLDVLRAAARDPEGYEPVFSPTHKQFVTAIEQTYCIFAPSGKYWGADEWREDESLDDNIARFARGLFRFMTVAKKEKFKGFAMRLPPEMSDSVERLAETTATFLAALNRIDPAGSRCLEQPVGSEDWKYEWAGETMFLTAFGTCYPEDHPRNPHGFGYTYYFIQPDFVLRAHPALTSEKEGGTRARILANFNKHGMSFSNENKRAESERYIRPVDPMGPPVRWWEYLPKHA